MLLVSLKTSNINPFLSVYFAPSKYHPVKGDASGGVGTDKVCNSSYLTSNVVEADIVPPFTSKVIVYVLAVHFAVKLRLDSINQTPPS